MFNAVTLEISLKPFKKTNEEFIRQVCQEVFLQWRPLIKNREEISVLFWTGDGSEILDYNRDLEQTFEWAYFIGTANLPLLAESDDSALSLHSKKQYYTENPPVMTYGILKNIIRIFKEEGKKFFKDKRASVASMDNSLLKSLLGLKEIEWDETITK